MIIVSYFIKVKPLDVYEYIFVYLCMTYEYL